MYSLRDESRKRGKQEENKNEIRQITYVEERKWK